jgi:hypothetical protein
MNHLIKIKISLSFLAILTLAGLNISSQYSGVTVNGSGTGFEGGLSHVANSSAENVEALETESEESSGSLNTQSDEIQDGLSKGNSNTKLSESSATSNSSELASNLQPSTRETSYSTSDLAPSNLTGNNTEETKKPMVNFERQLSAGLSSDLVVAHQPYKVKVTFDSMTVHNDHEGALSGDGEYDIAAYVQGIKVGLTDASGPGDGLWDVSSGETVSFDTGTEVTVDIPDYVPLSVLTVGSEVDGCDRTSFPASIQDPIAELIAKTPVGAIIGVTQMATTMEGIQDKINSAISWVGCKLNPNDIVGVINKAYEPTGYGAGSQIEKSDKGDFTLRYTISVTAPPSPQKDKTDLGSNLANQLNNDFSVLQPDPVK